MTLTQAGANEGVVLLLDQTFGPATYRITTEFSCRFVKLLELNTVFNSTAPAALIVTPLIRLTSVKFCFVDLADSGLWLTVLLLSALS